MFKGEKKMNEKTLNSIKSFLLNTLFPVIMAFLIGAILMLLIGEKPIVTYQRMITKSLFEPEGLYRTLHVAGSLILTGLAIAISFKANIFNMGVEGQMLVGGFFAGVFGYYVNGLPPVLHILLCCLVAIICGMLVALIPAILKAYFKVNEIVVTLMLNYAITEFLLFLCEGIFRDPNPAGYVATAMVQESAMFKRIGLGDITGFLFVSIIVAILVMILMKKTKLGYEIKAIGLNPSFAEATGANVRKKIIVIMLISGAISGLAGAGWMLSEKFRYSASFSGIPGLGWDGMLVSLLGGHAPLGTIIASIFYSALKVGMGKIELFTTVPKEIVSVIQALMILFLSVKYLNLIPKKNRQTKIKEKKEKAS